MEETIARRNPLNVFHSMEDFLNPNNHVPCSLVKIADDLNPFPEEVEIYAKLMYDFLTVKAGPAWNMIDVADKAGKLKGVHTITENTSGNAGFSLAFIAHLKKMNFVPFIPRDLAPGKREVFRLLGIDPIECNEAPNEPSGITKARELGKLKGIYCPGQYESEANAEIYRTLIAPEIFEQLNGEVSAFCTGVGTGGGIRGSGMFFREKSPKTKVIAAICEDGAAIPGMRSRKRLKDVKLDWESVSDFVFEISTKGAFRPSLKMIRTGILGGPTSGAGLAAINRFIEVARADPKTWEALAQKNGKVRIVFMCPDTFFPYAEKYSTHLDAVDLAPDFPPKVSVEILRIVSALFE